MAESGKEKLSSKPYVYLAGQWNEHDNNWKHEFDDMADVCDFHDPEIHSDQTSADTYFPDDLNGVKKSHIMIANPGIAPSEATWMEIGYFYATHMQEHGGSCHNLIIVWKEERNPKWSIDFIKKCGTVVSTVEEAKEELKKILGDNYPTL